MGTLKGELEEGITYLSDNTPQTIAGTLKQVVDSRRYERTSAAAALKTYGAEAVARELDRLLEQVMRSQDSNGHRRVS
jgi:hypothetical protein